MKILQNFFIKLFDKRQNTPNEDIIAQWIKNGKQMPPPHLVKQSAIKNEWEKGNYDILIETGTYLGYMVEAQKHVFKKIYSIELGEELYINAVKRFEGDKNVSILQGDSGVILNELMPLISVPAIFWLDGHYSAGITARGQKECPIFEELAAIFAAKKLNHTILIDDARLFNGTNDYPSIEELNKFISGKTQKFSLTIENDIIKVVL